MNNRLNPDQAPVTAHPSASIVVVRDAGAGLEVLMTRRSKDMKFAPGAFVFPGGRVDDVDGTNADNLGLGRDGAYRIAALRELAEETGLMLPESAAQSLIYFAHWITPPQSPKRFETKFYLTHAPENQALRHDGTETVEALWISPRDILEGEREGRYAMMFPTRLNVMLLEAWGSVEDALEGASTQKVVTCMPEMEMRDGEMWFTIPPEAGYPISQVHRNSVFELMGQKPGAD